MSSIFFDAKEILLIDYLQSGKTISGEYYCSLLDQLNAMICEKRPGLAKKNIPYLQENASTHKCALVIKKIV